jgi:hypothetical protein
MTPEQRAALEEYVFLVQATRILDRRAELEMARNKLLSRLDIISAVAADVHCEAETALDKLIKSFED